MNKKVKNILNKKNKTKVICLTAYSKNVAFILDKHCDLILVGDSLGSVLYNYKSTKEVTLDIMIKHSKSVRLGVKKSLMVVDMPYNTYRSSKEALKEHGLYHKIWQAYAALLPVKTVGVMGDNRTYEYLCLLRAITSEDGMTADFYEFKKTFSQMISNKIVNSIRGINRVVYDITSKPPSTIELE